MLGEKERKSDADCREEMDGGARSEKREEKAGRSEKKKEKRRMIAESASDSEDGAYAARKRREKRNRKRDISSSSEDGSTSSEEEEKRSRRHKKRKGRRRESDSSQSESESEERSRRGKRRHSKHGDRKRNRREHDSASELSTDSDDQKAEKKTRDRSRKSGDKSKSSRELDRKRVKKEKKKKRKQKLGSGAVTDRYGKYGVIRESDMWNKRPEFAAWLAEVKHVNIETLPNWDEREMFKDFMEDYNTATFPSKKFYNLELHHRNKLAKAHARGQQAVQAEKVVFDDEAEKRVELQRQRDLKKEEDYQAYKASMAAGMAQDMRDQDRLRNEMQYQYRLGNMEAVDTIKRRLAPEEPNTVVP